MSDRVIRLKLPYPPSANEYWTTRVVKSKATGKPMAIVHPSTEAQAFKKLVAKAAILQSIGPAIVGRFALHYVLHPHQPQDWAARVRNAPADWEIGGGGAPKLRCIDLDNAQKVLLDSLRGIAFEDDDLMWRGSSARGEPVPGGQVVVTITPWQPPAEEVEALLARAMALKGARKAPAAQAEPELWP